MSFSIFIENIDVKTEYEINSQEKAVAQIEKIKDEFYAKPYSGNLNSNLKTLKINIEGSELTETQNILRSFGIKQNEEISIIWISENKSIKSTFGFLSKYLDEIWYPSSDDIWVTNNKYSWLIEIDHEENLTIVSKIENI